MRSTPLLRALLVAIVSIAVASGTALAHRPWFNDTGSPDPESPYILEDLDVSQVVYGGLDQPGRVDYYRLTATEGFEIDLQVVVPAVDACSEFRPTFVVSGAGLVGEGDLPEAVATPLAGVPSIVVEGKTWGEFYEPFTATLYWTSPRFRAELATGDYLIAVYEPTGRTGTYGLSLGGSEQFGGDPMFLLKIGPYENCEPPPVDIPATPTVEA